MSNVLHNFTKTCNHAESQTFFGFFYILLFFLLFLNNIVFKTGIHNVLEN